MDSRKGMDLGYSSSDSDTDDENAKKRRQDEDAIDGGNKKEEEVTSIDIDIRKVFHLDSTEQSKRRKLDDRSGKISRAISKVLNDKVEIDSTTGDDGELDGGESESAGKKGVKNKLGIPKDAVVAELDMSDFYKHNQEELESGRLNAERQAKIGDIVYHREAGHSNAGRLDRVIQFNLNNEEKIMYQNKERIAKEMAIAREKANAGRG